MLGQQPLINYLNPGTSLASSTHLQYGRLHLQQLTLGSAAQKLSCKAVVKLEGQDIDAQFRTDGARDIIRFRKGIDIAAGQTLQVQIHA